MEFNSSTRAKAASAARLAVAASGAYMTIWKPVPILGRTNSYFVSLGWQPAGRRRQQRARKPTIGRVGCLNASGSMRDPKSGKVGRKRLETPDNSQGKRICTGTLITLFSTPLA